MIKLTFRHDGHVTKRTFRFKEIDDNTGKMEEQTDTIVGTLYIKKTSFQEGVCPDEITVKLEW